MSTTREPLAVEFLVSKYARRESDDVLDLATAEKKPVTVMDHGRFRESIVAAPVAAGDELDELIEELRTTGKP